MPEENVIMSLSPHTDFGVSPHKFSTGVTTLEFHEFFKALRLIPCYIRAEKFQRVTSAFGTKLLEFKKFK